jgi:stage II sporulation protein P
MYQKTGKRVGLALLAMAVTVRMLASSGVNALAARAMAGDFDAARFAGLTAAVVVGAAPPQEEEPKVWVLKILPPRQETPAPTPLTYSPADAETITIAGSSTYTPDKSALLMAPLSYENTAAPSVLIVHTHTSEAYAQTAGWTYTESDPLRTTEDSHSVIRVGQAVADTLTARGISVLHDTTYHDYPDYNGAYRRTLETIEAHLQAHPTIQVVLDLHRDATVRHAVATPAGDAAKIMLVVGTDEGGLTHPDWQKNLSLALKVQAAGGRRLPGLFRDIDLRTERFNQHTSTGALLVEVGSTGNTLPEALTAAELFADALADVLVGT